MDVAAWLRGLGLGQYEQSFRENDVDAGVLADLTAEDLIGLGVASIGHRRKLLAAIAALRAGSISATTPATSAPAAISEKAWLAPEAERRQLTVMFVDLVDSTALAARLDPEEIGRSPADLSERSDRRDRAVRRARGKVHGGWCAGLFRLSARP